MSNAVVIHPGKLSGQIDIKKESPSKSELHRAAICTALSGDMSALSEFVGYCDDVDATVECLRSMYRGEKSFDVRDSASTLRFLLPLTLLNGGGVFHMGDSLRKRPILDYSEIISSLEMVQNDGRLDVCGTLTSGRFCVQPDISSQFVSGLLFALPLVDGDSSIEITSPLESKRYVHLTIDILNRFGVIVSSTESGFNVHGGQKYFASRKYEPNADWSYAANYVVANCLGCSVDVCGMNNNSVQADQKIMSLLEEKNIDISQTPDLFPILCVLAAARNGEETHIFNGKRLRIKESDRINSMVTALEKLGVSVSENGDGVEIIGKGFVNGGTVDSCNDHRVVMAISMLATISKDDIVINNPDCVSKSCPRFFNHLTALGGRVDFI